LASGRAATVNLRCNARSAALSDESWELAARLHFRRAEVSTNKRLYDDAEIELGDVLAASTPSQEQVLIDADRKAKMRKAVDEALPHRLKRVLWWRFEDGLGLSEVGERLGGLSRERARQLELEAIIQLRRSGALSEF
jgi:RNA polymerase sigma factor (sigma-70 family)